jgi:hypothetical protein
MVSAETRSVIDRAKKLYAERLQTTLEAEHRDRFVAIEPESGDYFLDDALDGAVRAAREKHPDRISHVIRVGHKAAIHIGEMTC